MDKAHVLAEALINLDEYVSLVDLYEWLNSDEPWMYYGNKGHN